MTQLKYVGHKEIEEMMRGNKYEEEEEGEEIGRADVKGRTFAEV